MLEKQNFDPDKYLNQQIQKRAVEMGVGGEWSIKLEVKIGAKPIEKHLEVLHLTNLNETSAKLIFNLIDEQNTRSKRDVAEYKLSLWQAQTEIDFNHLPNINTIFYQ